jgi:hypothetical protein
MRVFRMSDIKGIAAAMDRMERWKNATGNLYGASWGLDTGKLPREYVDEFDKCNYAVYSYETPIAWTSGASWIMPVKYYSGSTSRHQSIVRQAIALI